jgi:hypothetical protein
VQTRMVPAARIVNGCYLSGLVPWENVAPDIDTTNCIVPGSWDAVMSDLDREEPAFVIDASRHQLFASGKYPPSKFPRLAAFLGKGYTMVKKIGAYDLYVRNDRAASESAPADPARSN